MHTAEQSENPEVLIGVPAVHPCTQALKLSATLQWKCKCSAFVDTCFSSVMDKVDFLFFLPLTLDIFIELTIYGINPVRCM